MKRRMDAEYDSEMRIKIQTLIDQCYPTYRIAKTLGLADRTVRVWIAKLKLIPAKDGILLKNGKRFKRCPRCNVIKEIEQHFNKKRSENGIVSWCKPCQSQVRREHGRGFKEKCVNYKGGKCMACGYSKCLAAMNFHHRDPTQKDYQISEIRTKPWKDVVVELDKCDLLCRNCHAELHDQIGWEDGQLLRERKLERMPL
jgi:hypothetical protein